MTETHDEHHLKVCIREIPKRLIEGKKLKGEEGRCQICGNVDILYGMKVSVERANFIPVQPYVMEVNIPMIQRYGVSVIEPYKPIVITELP